MKERKIFQFFQSYWGIKTGRRLYYFIASTLVIGASLMKRIEFALTNPSYVVALIIFGVIAVYLNYWFYMLLGYHLCFKKITSADVLEKNLIPALIVQEITAFIIKLLTSIIITIHAHYIVDIIRFLLFNITFCYLMLNQTNLNKTVLKGKLFIFVAVQIILDISVQVLRILFS